MIINEKRKLLRKKIVLLSLISLLCSFNCYEHVYNPSYEILIDDKAFAKYSKGKIYIGDEEFLKDIEVNEGDILVEDQRFGDNPNMQIYCSSDICDKDIRNEILEVLCRYEECYPSPWDRTIESMRVEWFMHNFSFQLNHRQDRTRDVDLDNEDEVEFDNELIRRLFKL